VPVLRMDSPPRRSASGTREYQHPCPPRCSSRSGCGRSSRTGQAAGRTFGVPVLRGSRGHQRSGPNTSACEQPSKRPVIGNCPLMLIKGDSTALRS
jgi:hypothetical protein